MSLWRVRRYKQLGLQEIRSYVKGVFHQFNVALLKVWGLTQSEIYGRMIEVETKVKTL